MGQDVQQILEEALTEGQNILIEDKVASCVPGLAKADSSNLSCCIMSTDGSIYKAGDYNIPFTMQSIAKAFSLILTLQTSGYGHTFSKVGMEPAGDRFGNILQLELRGWRSFNPMINAGAIATVNCITAADPLGEFPTLVRKLYGSPKTQLNEKVYHSEKQTGTRNRSIACLLESDHVLDGESEDVPDIRSRMCSVMYTTKDLTHYVMALPDKGVDPKTGERLLNTDVVRVVAMPMMFYGVYDESGEYTVGIGLPSKSGVGGGIVAAGQNGMGIGTFGPMLNKRGNSVGDERILQYPSERLGYHIFA